jgi:archaellum component FlaF (FlaF/FlaG flagellin family)
MSTRNRFLPVLVSLGVLLASAATVANADKHYEVTITNLTRTESFTPVLVASHRDGVSIFDLGSPASDELSALAEGGDTVPLTTALKADARVVDVQQSDDLLEPGASITVKVLAKHGARRISLASMMIPTNDGFIALNDAKAPVHGSAT